MNKITHEGHDYEVLSLDRISEITHARLAGGKVVEAQPASPGYFKVRVSDETDLHYWNFKTGELTDVGIQPLKLLEKVPVEFTGKVTDTVMGAKLIRVPDDVPLGAEFRCTQIVEVTK